MEKAQHGLDFFDSLKAPLGEGFFLSRQGQRRFLLRKYSNLAHRGMPPPLQSPAGGTLLFSIESCSGPIQTVLQGGVFSFRDGAQSA